MVHNVVTAMCMGSDVSTAMQRGKLVDGNVASRYKVHWCTVSSGPVSEVDENPFSFATVDII